MLLLCFVWHGQYGHWNCGSLPHSTFRWRSILVRYRYTFLQRGHGNTPGNLYILMCFVSGWWQCSLELVRPCTLSVLTDSDLSNGYCLLKLTLFCSSLWCNVTKSFGYNRGPHLEATNDESWTVSCFKWDVFSNSWKSIHESLITAIETQETSVRIISVVLKGFCLSLPIVE